MVRKSSRTPKPVLKPDPDPPIEEEEKRISKRGRKPKNKTNLEGIEGNEEKMVNQRKRKASTTASSSSKKKKGKNVKEEPETEEEDEPERNVEFRFVGDPIPVEEAHRRWPERYEPELIEKQRQEIIAIQKSKKDYCKDVDEPEEIPKVKCHYSKAFVDGTEYDLYDDAHVVSDKKDLPFICKVIEMFETEENELFFRAQWYYRPCDTVIREAVLDKEDEEQKAKDAEEGVEQTEVNEEIVEDDDDDDDLPKEDHTVHLHEKMIFTSDVQDNNSLDLLLGKICIARIPSNVDRLTKLAAIDSSDYFYELRYELPYKSFVSIPIEDNSKETIAESSGLSNVSLSKDTAAEAIATATSSEIEESSKSQLYLLDLYSGCGAMSTGLTLGAEIGGLNLVTRWAVDINQHACDTLELNHPDTYVRNEAAEDFLSLLKEWKIICDELLPQGPPNDHVEEDEVDADPEELPEELFVVESIVGISYGHPKTNADNLKKKNKDKIKPTELFFKIRWRGYGPDDDTWEPRSALSDAKLKLYEFVKAGYASKILPLPGDVDVICGGPPCQGISGFNRFETEKAL